MNDLNAKQSHIAKAMKHIQSAIRFGDPNDGTLNDGYSYMRKHTRWGDDDDAPVHGRTLADEYSDKKKHTRKGDSSDPKHYQKSMLEVVGDYLGEHVRVYRGDVHQTNKYPWRGEIHQTTNGDYVLTLTRKLDDKYQELKTPAGPYSFPLDVEKHTQSEFSAIIKPQINIKKKIPKTQDIQGITINFRRWDDMSFLMKIGKRQYMFWKEKRR